MSQQHKLPSGSNERSSICMLYRIFKAYLKFCLYSLPFKNIGGVSKVTTVYVGKRPTLTVFFSIRSPHPNSNPVLIEAWASIRKKYGIFRYHDLAHIFLLRKNVKKNRKKIEARASNRKNTVYV